VALEIVTDQGCKDTLVRSLQVQEPFLIYVPNAFTPNTDVSNDIFIPVMSGVKEYSFQIFNRWGQEIFVSTNPTQGWDGSYKGSACQQDEYVWKLRAKNESGEQRELIGNVLLYR
jgi:gliding motility-associated-like protein